MTGATPSIESAQDANWFKVSLTAGTTYDFTLSGLPTGEIYEIAPAAGTDTPAFVDGAPYGSGQTNVRNVTADTSGNHLVLVRELADNSTASYTLANPGALTVGEITAPAPTLVIEAFPFTRYGTVPGTVVSLSHDAVADPRLGAAYIARIRLARDTITVDGRPMPLTTGLGVTADIRTGSRRIISWLVSPLITTVDQAGHER